MSNEKVKRSMDRRQSMLIAYVASLAVLSLSFVLMPIGTGVKETAPAVLFVSGVLFWVGLITTIGVAIYINRCRREDKRFCEAYPDLRQLGLIHFFQNKPAKIADISMAVSIVAFVVVRLLFKSNVPAFIFLALTVFSFGMHCMLNGVNYRYLTFQTRREKEVCVQK